MGPASRLYGDHREVALQRRLRHPVPRPEAGLCRRGAGQQQGQLHRALQAAERECIMPWIYNVGRPLIHNVLLSNFGTQNL